MNDDISNINTPQELARFVRIILDSLINDPESWENSSLETYLAAIAAWVNDSEAYFINNGQPVPSPEVWKTVPLILYAGTRYE